MVVVDKGRSGILGLGAEVARVRVTVRDIDAVDVAKRTIEDLLRAMNVSASVGLPDKPSAKTPAAAPTPKEPADPKGQQPPPLAFNIDGEDAGLLIGRRGETLSSLQFLVNFILSRKTQGRVNVAIDVEGYRERRNEVLRAMALRMAERASSTGRSVTMDPMPARERRIIHLALAGHAKVTTQSVGEGEERKVTIIPKHQERRPDRVVGRPPTARRYS